MNKLLVNVKKFFLIVFSIIYLIPLYAAIVNSVKKYEDIIKSPLALPENFTLENFKLAYIRANIGSLYFNSFIITSISLLLIVFLASMLAYPIARNKNNVKYKILYIFILCGMMVPPQVVLIPSIKTLKFLNLLNTFPGIIFFYAGTYLSIGMFLYTAFIKTIPTSIEESGIIDGANKYTIFYKLIFPLLKPCTATVVIFLGMWIWNDFLPPMYILGSHKGRTITTGIYSAIGTFTTQWNIVFACVILASLPIIILYLFMQKQFQSGLTAGAIKG